MYSALLDENSPIFIVGLPRSGSTLWANVIGGRPDVVQFSGAHFLSVWHKDFRYVLKHLAGDLSQEQDVERLIELIFSKNPIIYGKHNFWFWKKIRDLEKRGLKESLRERIVASEKRDIGTIFRILIEEATRCSGQNRAVVKFPVYPAYLGDLIKWWPEARIVHISRDPRALAASKTNDPGGVSSLAKRFWWTKFFLPFAYKYFSVFQYIWASYMHTRFDGQANYRLFLYEDLLATPDKIIRDLCEFSGLEFDESMLNPSAGQASSVTGQKASGFDATRAFGWRKVLSHREAKFIRFIAGPSMRRFGYTPEE